MSVLSHIKRSIYNHQPSWLMQWRRSFGFDATAKLYKGMSYQDFLDEAFRDFAPNADKATRKRLEKDIYHCWLKYYTRPDEFFFLGFDKKNDAQRDLYISQKLKDKTLAKLYGEHAKSFLIELRNKYRFYQLAKPFFKRDAILVSKESQQKDFLNFASIHRRFIVKKIDSGCGVGVSVVNQDESDETSEQLFARLVASGVWIVEELVEQDERMAVFNASSVNTIRVPSFRKGDKVEIAFPLMRFGRKGSVVDNAGSGGFIAAVDLESGLICTDGFDEHGHIVTEHPDSHVKFKDFCVPEWQQMLEVAKKLHRSLPEHHQYIAFDFALSKKGWVVIEGNWGDWDLQQIVLQRGLKKEFLSYLS